MEKKAGIDKTTDAMRVAFQNAFKAIPEWDDFMKINRSHDEIIDMAKKLNIYAEEAPSISKGVRKTKFRPEDYRDGLPRNGRWG